MKVMLNEPLKLPGGLEAGGPTVRIPSIYKDNGVDVRTNGEAGFELPRVSLSEPPLLPARVISPGFRKETILPGVPVKE
jgi:hypothetical protein